MNKLLFLFFSVFFIALSGQNIRFFYDYKFVADSTKIDSTFTELMHLDVSDIGSKFYSRDVYITDSIVQDRIKNRPTVNRVMINNSNFKGRVRNIVEKYYPNFNINYFTNIGLERYRVDENIDLKWEILPDIMKIGQFTAQKAQTEVFGRKWIAWFSKDYPIQDGPYKFHGLPGLIIKIEDITHSHIFELKGVKKLNNKEKWSSENERKNAKKNIIVNEKKFKKAFIEDRNDPMKTWNNSAGGMVSYTVTNASGKPVDMRDVVKNREMMIKKDNNILELDLIKK
ncbi:GLPGLI family protein [Chryseobacterium chendengshani]|uniref:GLPGLI family protein n=1 Tax=Chryseobacterium sp. LJ668 TaxID=2864040 RepID=UPI001C68D9AA|nr:GLPGLI family protein [Chryseobacterium sp. LJ668]MBW8523796.1 GLPGLI family protein [Chryseobacterium sp. LJ668]QYK16739.1 GLPGLI family protein [Chryseobacterium sp. LJ668]